MSQINRRAAEIGINLKECIVIGPFVIGIDDQKRLYQWTMKGRTGYWTRLVPKDIVNRIMRRTGYSDRGVNRAIAQAECSSKRPSRSRVPHSAGRGASPTKNTPDQTPPCDREVLTG